MPDFIVEVAHTGQDRKVWTRDVTIQDASRDQAILLGIAELMKWCEEDSKKTPDSVPIPAKAYEYWGTARNTGLALYEVQSNLEAFGLSFGIKPVTDVTPSPPSKARAARQPQQNGNGKPHHPDFKEMLHEQLEFLQVRQKELGGERRRLQEEYEENQANIQQITSFLMIAAPAKKRGRPKAVAERTDQA